MNETGKLESHSHPTGALWSLRSPGSPAEPSEITLKSASEQSPTRAAPSSSIPRLVSEVMAARGFKDDSSIQRWLSPSLKFLKDPFALTDMDKAVARLVKAFEASEKIVIYADYDLDGTSGLALLLKAFELLGFKDVTFYQPKRLSEGYGLHNHAIQKLADEGRTLLLSVDLGITAIEETEFAKALGMDVIITDHHLPKEVLPDAHAVVNPNRGNCSSGLSHLCGTGVAFYLVLALKRTMLESGMLKENFDPKILLDCFTIGTVTDMVPLIDENRVLVKHGLLQLAQTRRPGLRVLLQALGMWGNPLTSSDVAIRFAPKLNALSRMELGIQPIDLYLVSDENEAHLLVEKVLSQNQTRQASQKNAESEAKTKVESDPPRNVIVVWSENFHRGVVGLVATRLCQEYGLPAFVGSLETETGKIVGSVRMPEAAGLSALDAMASASHLLEHFGGHAVAAGFEVNINNSFHFKSALEDYFASKQADVGPRKWIFDAETDLEELGPGFMTWYEHLSPFGAQFSAPIFRISGVRVAQIKALRGGHLRLTLEEARKSASAKARAVSRVALWFSPAKDHPLLDSSQNNGLTEGAIIDVLVEPQWNYFAGDRTLQFLIQDIREAALA